MTRNQQIHVKFFSLIFRSIFGSCRRNNRKQFQVGKIKLYFPMEKKKTATINKRKIDSNLCEAMRLCFSYAFTEKAKGKKSAHNTKNKRHNVKEKPYHQSVCFETTIHWNHFLCCCCCWIVDKRNVKHK